MAVLLKCPKGHQWEAATGKNTCPQCGAVAVASDETQRPTVKPDVSTPSLSQSTDRTSLPDQFGRYRIVRRLGKGGMGSVYLAHDTQLDRQVALKVPHFSAEDGPEVRERFYREARAAATLHHAGICPVHDVGEINGVPFLTMAYIEGRPLSQFVSADRPLTPRQVATLVRKLAQALQEAHQRGVIHRDLKPSNIMVNARGEPVVMDFGLARRLNKDVRITGSGTIMGTPAYMSPEQVNADLEAMGPHSDIYSLGVILYELLAGRLPFEGPMASVLAQIITKEPVPPSLLRAGVDPAMEAICRKAMAKEISQRYRSMADLAAALSDFLKATAGGGTQTQARPEAAFADLAVSPRLVRTATRKPRAPRGPSLAARVQAGVAKVPPKWRWLALAALVFLISLLGLVIYVATDHGTIRIELSDPNAKVEIKVDGTVEITSLDEPIKLKTGEHGLTVTGKNFETVTKTFTVKRGDNPAVRVELIPTGRAAGEAAAKGAVREQVSMAAATIPAPILPAPGKFALDFAASVDVGAAVDLPAMLRGNEPLTVEICLRPRVIPLTRRNCYLWSRRNLVLKQTESDWLWNMSNPDLSLESVKAKNTVQPGRRAYLAGVSTGSELRLFVDGQLVGTSPFDGQVISEALPCRLGMLRPFSWAWGPFDGTIDTVRISKVARYDKNFTPPKRFEADADTLALYRFDEGQGDVLRDSSGNNHHGKIIGARWVKATEATFTNSLGMKLALIPAGRFLMGSPTDQRDHRDDEAQHSVELTRDFWIGTQEVTVGQFHAFVRATGHRTDAEKQGGPTWDRPGFAQTEEHPVAFVSWNDAAAFCAWLARQERGAYRLPTEAEWEYACRAGTTTLHSGGDDYESLAKVGNVPDASLRRGIPDWKTPTIAADDGYVHTAPVGRFPPNAFGLFDMQGNAWEWCADWYAPYDGKPTVDPVGPSSGDRRIVRGGGWGDVHPLNARSANRAGDAPESCHRAKGFRVAMTPAEPMAPASKPALPGPPSAFTPLFNGGNLTGWKLDSGHPGDWGAILGDLVFDVMPGKGGWLLTEKEYGDFILRLQFQLGKGSRSGVAIRAAGNRAPRYLEIQLQDDSDPRQPPGMPPTGSLIWSSGSLHLPPDPAAALKPFGEWNDLTIEVRNQTLRVLINGRPVRSNDLAYLARQPDALPELQRPSGRIGLQAQAGTARFRYIEIQELPASKP